MKKGKYPEMKNVPETNNIILPNEDSAKNDLLKTWETPKLRVLSVPTKTNNGFFVNKAKPEDTFYKKS